MTDSIIDNDIHTNPNPNDTMDIDIFAPPPPSPEDEMSTTLKRELDVLRVQLRSLVQNVPAEAAGITDFEDWCQRWTDMTGSLTQVMKLLREHKVDAQLTDAERQDGHAGTEIYRRVRRQLTIMQAVVKDAEDAARADMEAEKERSVVKDMVEEAQKETGAHAEEKEVHAEEKEAQAEEKEVEKEVNPEQKEADVREKEAHAKEKDADVPEVQADELEEEGDAQEEEGDAQDEADDAQEKEADMDEDGGQVDSPIKRTARVYTTKKVTSDPDIEILKVVPKVAEPHVQNTNDDTGKDVEQLNVIPCERCVELKTQCFRAENSNACKKCKSRKIACSLVPGKHKPSPPPNPPAPAPTPQPASTSKTRPVKSSAAVKAGRVRKATTPTSPPPQPSKAKVLIAPRPGTAAKAGPAPKAIAGKGKAADASPQRVTPGPIQRAYVELTSRKRKAQEAEDDSSNGESDEDEDEDAYLAGRVNGLNTFVTLFETALGALKKEVTEIDGYLAKNRHRRRRRRLN